MEELQLLEQALADLTLGGSSSDEAVRSLSTSLDVVARHLEAGRTDQAAALLRAFQHRVGAFAVQGALTAEEEAVLVDAAQNAIDQLTG